MRIAMVSRAWLTAWIDDVRIALSSGRRTGGDGVGDEHGLDLVAVANRSPARRRLPCSAPIP
jgi:hypothetical protein